MRLVRVVAAGGRWLEGGRVRGETVARAAAADPARLLTARELEIVGMVSRGLRNRDIALPLGISEGTVKIHLHNIYQKLGVDGRLQLLLFAQAAGMG
jgi:DNA-binding NarL/FixJ family response regulator